MTETGFIIHPDRFKQGGQGLHEVYRKYIGKPLGERIRKGKYVSRFLRATGHEGLAGVAEKIGLGKRRKHRHKI